jgi:iron complex outermembrane receptor protein
MATAAASFEPEHDLRIERQPLARALQEFAKQSGVQIIFFSSIARGREAPPLHGRFTTAAALEQMLQDSQLTFRQINTHTIEICLRTAVACGANPSLEAGMNENTSIGRKLAGHDRRARRARALSGALVSAAAVTAQAQDKPALEEVVVTAQKREERLQDVPVAVTALSGDQLASAGINDTASLTTLTPSLTFTEGAHPANKNFRIRGIGTAVFGQGLEPSVSVVVDGIVLARAAQGFADLADIERVEVLRGPQGTLFGKNSIGGVINVVTKRPSTAFEADMDVTVAERNEYRARGSISGPLSEAVGARLTGYYNDVDGHIRNLTLDRNVNGHEDLGFRGKLEWDPTDRFNVLFMADYRESDTTCCSSQMISVVNPVLAQSLLPVVAGFNNRQEVDNAPTSSHTDQKTFSIEANYELEALTLTSLSAFQDFFVENDQPVDRLDTPLPLYLPVTNGSFDVNDGTIDIQQFTQEFRVTSPGQERFNYVAGVYFLDLDLDRTFERRVGNCAPGGAPAQFGQPCIVPLYRSQAGFHANTTTQNVAVFGQTDFNLVGNLSALAGARFQYEEITYDGVRTDARVVPGDLPLPGFSPSSGSGKSDDTVLTGKLGLQYEFSDYAQTYLTWSTGYKGAGYEVEFATTFENQQAIKPEEAKAWELGFKAQLFDGLLSLNSALFYAEYEDLQVQANRGNPDLGIVRFATTNAGSATTEGIELEFVFRPLDGLSLSGGATYLESSVDIDGLNCPLSFQAAAPVMVGSSPINVCYRPAATASPIQNVRDGSLPSSPEWRGNLTARYDFDVPGTSWSSFVQLAASSQSKMNFVIEQDPLTVHDSYTIVDASLGFRDQTNRYRLTLFAKNLFDEHYVTQLARSATLSTATVTPDNLTGIVPKEANRYFGATFGVSF